MEFLDGFAQICTAVELRTHWQKQGLQGLSMRIGVNTRMAVVGNMGSIDRMDYTMMGDAVSLAARLESANKFYGTGILLSEYTYALVKDTLCRELDRVRVQGKRQPVDVYQLIDEHSRIGPSSKLLCEAFALALGKFRQGHWSQAEELFKGILLKHQDDSVSQVYLARSQQLQMYTPEAGWDGIYDLQK